MTGPASGVRVLVAYASAHGSTKGVARAIADRLRAAGLRVEVRPVDEVGNLGDELARRPLWLFSVSSVGETSSFFGPRGTYGDHRDWADIKAWADRIADQLAPAPQDA